MSKQTRPASSMANLDLGRRFRTGDEATKAAARRGGRRSGEARRQRRAIQADLERILCDPLPDTKGTAGLIKRLGLAAEDHTAQLAMLTSMVIKAAAGDVKAARFCVDVLGESAEAQRAETRLKLDQERLALAEAEFSAKIDQGGLPIIINIRPDMLPKEGEGSKA